MEELYKIIQQSIENSKKAIDIANQHNKTMIDWVESLKKSIESMKTLLPN